MTAVHPSDRAMARQSLAAALDRRAARLAGCTLLITEIAARFDVTPAALCSPERSRTVVAARRAAMEALQARGLSQALIAVALGVSRATVEYHLDDGRRRTARLKRHREAGAA